MPVTSAFWPHNHAQDIHLIPGYTGPRLDHLLWIADSGGNRRADNPPGGVVVVFAANVVIGSPGTAGVAVAANGEVTVTAPLAAAPRLLDFVITATVTEGANVFTARKRFHIHGALTRIWLTPSTLTVRQAAAGMRFTVLAEFDDGTYGDLTNWCPWNAPAAADRTFVRQNGIVVPAIAWTTTAAGTIGVHADTGVLNGVTAAGNATIDAKIKPLPAPAARSATGTGRAAPPWATPAALTHIAGPGFAAMATSPNVLILPDGFQAADRAAFERVARDLVRKLGWFARTRPFDLLKDRINYFSTWVESREAGISPLSLVFRHNVAGTRADALELETFVDPATVAAAFTIAAPPVPAAVTDFLLNERDTAFHSALGERPKADRYHQLRGGHFHGSRFDEGNFDAFLNALQDTLGATVGGVWATTGKDQANILVLGRTKRNGGANNSRSPSGRYICMTLDRADEHRIESNAAGLGKDIRPDAIPGSAHIEIWTTAAHELAHSFSINDEYGGGGAFPAGRVAEVAAIGNLDARANLLTGVNLDANKIKWRWPRIEKAGTLAAVPVAVGGNYRVQLEPGHAASFAVNDVVRFRLRPLLGAPAATHRFVVDAVAGDNVDVRPLVAAPFVPAGFPAGSVLIAPKRAPDPNPANNVYGDDLLLVHTSTIARINATRNPLNAAHADPLNRPCPGIDLPVPSPATNYADTDGDGSPDPPSPPKYSSWIVGLYENGLMFSCDIYHPTGVCIMKVLHYEDKPASTNRSYQFCTVCRYVMVDLLDPSQHSRIDKDYDSRYPT